MKKRIFNKILSIVLVCVMTLTSMGAYSGERSAMASEAEVNFAELVSVVVYETKDQILTAYVEADKVAEFTYRLENEIGYRETQIADLSMAYNESNINGSLRCPPPPSNYYYLSSSTMMDIGDIQSNINAGEESMRELTYLIGGGASTIIMLDWVLKLGAGPIIGLYTTFFGIGGAAVQSKIDSYNRITARILSGEIAGLCHCIYVNTGSEYPKAWSYETIIYN